MIKFGLKSPILTHTILVSFASVNMAENYAVLPVSFPDRDDSILCDRFGLTK
jgi:hypothetical protein